MSKTKYAIRRAKPGLGLFASAPIAKGDFVVEYTGRHITTEEADRLTTRYLFEVDDDWTIDGSARSNIARYVNHSCTPNCEAEIHDSKVLFFATEDIEAGAELTIDYGEEYFKEFIEPQGCKCMPCARKDLAISERA